MPHMDRLTSQPQAAIAQLGERQTEDLQVPGSPGLGNACGMGWQQTCQALARGGLVAEYIVAVNVTDSRLTNALCHAYVLACCT